MPRVLCVLNRLIIGGPSIIAAYLTHYARPEFETLMVIGGKDDHEQDANFITDQFGIQPVVVPEMRRAIKFRDDRAAYRRIKEIIRDFKPDIVHTHAAKSGALGRLAAFATKVPVTIHTFHGHVFHSYFSPLKTQAFIRAERFLAARSSGIIAISELQKEELAGEFRICAPEKIRVIPLGLDLAPFREGQAEKRAAFRGRYGVEDDEIVIGLIGRIVPVKNHALFLAMAEELARNTGRRLRFFLIGDGDERPLVEAECRTRGLDYTYYPESPRRALVTCTSWQTRMDEVYAAMDIVALTSHNEGTPVSLIEAQAAGKPVLATNVGGVADTMADGRTGFLVPAGGAKEGAERLLRLVEDEALRASMGAAGRAFAEEKFSVQKMVQETTAYYHELLEGARMGRKG
ncbi:glycosyltransferase family 4 protein [Flaviaesturariibacter aridisoli]|uniref:Glycosyltransferase family 1 protein n=1 Tax=Flaviaesturariibacter aridisoli TaxID=2545761 RepID=A0A4R4E633_9BACT|nr:glycosyltransferase family 4 protein [Flaviaesturariibacter aridisoli]TCZ73138.1 glycosyltransferase family 1 protein [Flaviaesturariibacter aridisoli]